MEQYDRRTVFAPVWMENFSCIAGRCTETCCQQWDIDVDEAHALKFRQLDDPELRPVMDRTLSGVRVRRPGTKTPEMLYRLRLLEQPDRRCPFLNENAECRLQKKYGAAILCDTCYFHPRTFRQIDDETLLSACLSCPECARLALLHEEPLTFTRFEAEIDPNAEWLETELIPDAGVRDLLRRHDRLISTLCGILQDRKLLFPDRMTRALAYLESPGSEDPGTGAGFSASLGETVSAVFSGVSSAGSDKLMEKFIAVFDPVSTSMEKPAQSAALFMRQLAGGEKGYAALLAENFRKGSGISGSFLADHPWLEENLMVHCVFSDSFKQFFRYQNDPLTVTGLLRHEAALLTAWAWFFRVRLSLASLEHGCMDEDLFLKTVMHTDRNYLHYPDWFARCAERLKALTESEIRIS